MDKAKKKRIRKYASWIALAAVVVLLTAMPLLARSEAEADGPVASVLTAEVTEGTITTVLRGGGTLSADNVEEVKLPDGVKITEFLVKNGESVTAGTPLAAVDRVSVMTAITEVGETLEYLREELEDARDEKVPANITAPGGRVKKIFAREGESVQDVMLRDGALAILSLDGMMAVKIENPPALTTGETVSVALADGTEAEGRVESNLDGVAVITVEDQGYEIGQTVTVSLNGTVLGEGSLYVHNAWKATAYTGTVSSVKAAEEKEVSEGGVLFTLSDRDYEGELRRRANQHREYEELLQDLFQMYESGTLCAPCDGEVEGVDEDSAFLLSAVPEGWVPVMLTSYEEPAGEKGWTVMLLSNSGDTQQCTGDENCTLPADASGHYGRCIKCCDWDDRGCDAQVHYEGCISQCTGEAGCLAYLERHKDGCPEKCTGDAFCQSTRPIEEHLESCIVYCVRDTDGSDGDQCGTGHAHDPLCIGSCTGTGDCNAINHKADCPLYGLTYTARVGIVVRAANGTLEYKYDSSTGNVPVTRAADGSWILSVTPNPLTMNTTGFVACGTEYSAGDMILIITAQKGENVVFENQVYLYAAGSTGGSTGGYGDLGSLSGIDISAMIGGLTGFGSFGTAAAQEEEPLFDLEGTTLLTVIPKDTATLTVAIDEHDISRLTTGMAATVRVEALKGEEFPAEITGISLSGSNSGGSSKFQVELTLSMSEDMLSGMSASAEIPLEEKQNILMIPAAALVQQGTKTLVYTSLDDSGAPAAAVEVATGVTDGEHVEILSGLEKGQTIYYSYYDTVEVDRSAEEQKFTFH